MYLSFIYLYFCCSHLEHRASVKCFVSLQFRNLRQAVGLLRREIGATQGSYLHINTEKSQTNIHALNGIGTHDPNFVRAEVVHALDRAAIVIGQNCI
jgi:hypothetical protein